jgi:hypothetical protein
MDIEAADDPFERRNKSTLGREKMKQKNPPEDTYARDSFSFRRMSKWQLWSISIVVAVLVIVSIAYLY